MSMMDNVNKGIHSHEQVEVHVDTGIIALMEAIWDRGGLETSHSCQGGYSRHGNRPNDAYVRFTNDSAIPALDILLGRELFSLTRVDRSVYRDGSLSSYPGEPLGRREEMNSGLSDRPVTVELWDKPCIGEIHSTMRFKPRDIDRMRRVFSR